MLRVVSRRSTRAALWTLVLAVAALAASQQTTEAAVKLVTRPLTPQEIKDYSLPSSTQKSGGTVNTGLGQPLYLEVLITKGTTVTSVDWTLTSVPTGAKAVLQASPLPSSMPPYDKGDAAAYDVAGRQLLVPDADSLYWNGDYEVSAKVNKTTGYETATLTVYGSTFLSNNMSDQEQLCSTVCHEGKSTLIMATQHADAFTRKINGVGVTYFGQNCISCHVLGYDTNTNAVNFGFDDVATEEHWTLPTVLTNTNWDAMPPRLQDRSNIQCENCHGPAKRHFIGYGDEEAVTISLSAGNCGQCHDSMTYHVKNNEWQQSAHSGPRRTSSGSCQICHSTKGFVQGHDPDYADGKVVRGSYNEGITCVACHDPHAAGMGAHQLREMENATLANGTVIEGYGDALICMNCHKSRRNASTYVDTTNSEHFGPHYGTQTDMLFGQNAYEYGIDMPTSRHFAVVEETCVQCHMQETPTGLGKNKVGGHTFKIAWEDPSSGTEVHLTEACASCHGEIEEFNFGGQDYDQDGTVEGVQKEIEDMLHELSLLLPPVGSTDVSEVVTAATPLNVRRAAYNYEFVHEDGSHGVHNPKYAAALLRASIDDMKGGIDNDHDGLIDSWEIQQFGDLTSQTGDGDADGDGLTNKEEYALGTDPEEADSDHDGQSDLVEVQGGSNPLDPNSKVDPTSMTILSAVELGYLPAGTGTVVQFQMNDALVGGGWTNIGPTRVSAGGWLYQLESTRGSQSRFFRAVEDEN